MHCGTDDGSMCRCSLTTPRLLLHIFVDRVYMHAYTIAKDSKGHSKVISGASCRLASLVTSSNGAKVQHRQLLLAKQAIGIVARAPN